MMSFPNMSFVREDFIVYEYERHYLTNCLVHRSQAFTWWLIPEFYEALRLDALFRCLNETIFFGVVCSMPHQTREHWRLTVDANARSQQTRTIFHQTAQQLRHWQSRFCMSIERRVWHTTESGACSTLLMELRREMFFCWVQPLWKERKLEK